MSPSAIAGTGLRSGTPEFIRLQRAMLAAALAAFALMYCTQPLLPAIGSTLGGSPATVSLTVSATTGVLALAIVPLSGLADAIGRLRLMRYGLALACLLVVASAAAPNLAILITIRALIGLALAAVVAVAMGHVGDEVHPNSLGSAMGFYVAGNSLGGVGGRLIAAAAGDGPGWRYGVLAVGLLAGLATLVFSYTVPEPVRFRPVPLRWSAVRSGVLSHLADAGIVRLCLIAFLLMGGFVATYNYLAFRLLDPPFRLSQGVIGLVFLAYLAGTAASAQAGRLADRWGSRPTLLGCGSVMAAGLLLTLPDQLAAIVAGLLIFTAGFFGAHAVASGWVSSRARAGRAQASALYLLAYYAGSSVLGAATGLAYAHSGWPLLVGLVGGYLVAALGLAATIGPAGAADPAGG